MAANRNEYTPRAVSPPGASLANLLAERGVSPRVLLRVKATLAFVRTP